jgi:rhodanese-related sulfurtransferase
MATVAALAATVAVAQYKVPTSGTGRISMPPPSNSGPLQITTANQETQQLSSAPRISRAEAQKLVKNGKAVFVDVRSKETYDKGHLPGAISIPGSQLLYRLQELPVGKKLITYCACVEEHTAAVAVLNLEAHKIKNAAALQGGWNDWRAAGLPIEVTGAPH